MSRGARIYFLFIVHTAPASESMAMEMCESNEARNEESQW